jgi:enoyl-CoA hydratase/carnithine racemase
LPDLTTITVARSGHVVEVTLARPDRLNAFDPNMRRELRSLWESLRDDSNLRCIIITAEGRAFCGGADVGALADGDYAPAEDGWAASIDFLPGEWLTVPVIAAVNGLCVGGGLHFIADADLVIASESAWFGDPHVSVGLVSAIEPLTLLGRIPWNEIANLVLRGKNFRMTASHAFRVGLVQQVVPADALMDTARSLAAEISSQSPTAVQKSLGILRKAQREPLQRYLDEGWDVLTKHQSHPDAVEGTRAFTEKREPRWQART